MILQWFLNFDFQPGIKNMYGVLKDGSHWMALLNIASYMLALCGLLNESSSMSPHKQKNTSAIEAVQRCAAIAR